MEVIRRLVGEIQPYGDSAIDRERTNNLEEMIQIINDLLYDVEMVGACRNRPEYSMKIMAKKADDAMGSWLNWLLDWSVDEND